MSVFEIIDGGAVVISRNSNVTFENCKFLNNDSILCAGAISNQSKGVIKVVNCLFKNNSAGHTGSAIDNLISNSHMIVRNCRFINNVSNAWHIVGYPHGQISSFPNTTLRIENSTFQNGSIPFDTAKNVKLYLYNNQYEGFGNWNEHKPTNRIYPLLQFTKFYPKMFWVIPKTIGRVYYRINKR